MDYIKAGIITHYFDKIGVGVLVVTDETIKQGDKIRIGEFGVGVEQEVDSMQVEHDTVTEAKVGQEVGLKVATVVKKGDIVYKISG
jgi:selenocysteine-specific translation elongation factor